jgi:hypothetical protein
MLFGSLYFLAEHLFEGKCRFWRSLLLPKVAFVRVSSMQMCLKAFERFVTKGWDSETSQQGWELFTANSVAPFDERQIGGCYVVLGGV